MIAPKEDAKDQWREGIRCNQPGGLGFEERKNITIAKDDENLRDRELYIDQSENEKDARVSQKGLWLINPELTHRGGKKEERDDKVFCWFLFLPAENQQSQTGDKGPEDCHLHPGGMLEI